MTNTVIVIPQQLCDTALEIRMQLAQAELERVLADKSTLPANWTVTQITDTKIRVNALSESGEICHWILDVGADT